MKTATCDGGFRYSDPNLRWGNRPHEKTQKSRFSATAIVPLPQPIVVKLVACAKNTTSGGPVERGSERGRG